MQQYKNLGRDSNVKAFEIGSDHISVQFQDTKVYVYTYASAGQINIEQMKKLALTGQGLNAFINKHVKKRYASKC